MKTRRLFAAIATLFWSLTSPLCAHPLGNFTVNHLTKLAVTKTRVDIRYLLDMAEIPTYSALHEATTDGKISSAELSRWARREGTVLLPALRLSQAGRRLVLVPDRAEARTRPGAGGLPTLYFIFAAHAQMRVDIADGPLVYEDTTFAGRLGWRDVVVAPAAEPTHDLTAYPSGAGASARGTAAVSIAFDRAGRAIAHPISAVDDGVTVPPAMARSNALSDMLARGTADWTFVLLTLLVAIGLGALHALEPGHGKTLLAISLVGARATVKQATILAAALTIAHTIGVFALGVAIQVLRDRIVPEAIYPWITLGSGSAIAIVGARAVQRGLQQKSSGGTIHAHAGVRHSHAAGHVGRAHDDDERAHAALHAMPGEAPLTFGASIWAALSGGVAPCPAALVVLLAALALNQVAYGTFVIVAFSAGLAATLTGLGIAVVRGASWLADRPQLRHVVKSGPLISGVLMSTIGAIVVGQGFVQEGVARSPFLVSAIVALAIAGYGLSHPFSHRHVEVA